MSRLYYIGGREPLACRIVGSPPFHTDADMTVVEMLGDDPVHFLVRNEDIHLTPKMCRIKGAIDFEMRCISIIERTIVDVSMNSYPEIDNETIIKLVEDIQWRKENISKLEFDLKSEMVTLSDDDLRSLEH